LWAANGFDIGTLPPELPTMSALSGMTMPLAGYVEQVLDIGGRLRVGTPSFLLGQYSDSGWWMYFPVAFLLKTPLATLLLLTWGGAAYGLCLLRRGARCPVLVDSAALLIPALGFFAIALTTDINLGYRHILPALPFLIVFAVTAVGRRLLAPLEVTAKVDEMAGEGAEKAAAQIRAARRRDLRGIAPALALAAWLGLATLFIYPDFLAFFNLLAGGPDNGWRSLVDSNLDWGQDLDDLAPWMAGHGVDEVWLSYFGEARPEAYGIAYQGLDSFPPRLMDPAARPFYPADPAPGIYAISATNLQGVHFADHDQFAFFRGRAPLDKLGYSIFLYDVPPHGRPVDLLLAGVQVDEIAPEAYARLGSNDARLRWFDPTQTLLLPGVESFWWAGSDKTPVHPLLGAYLDLRLSDSSEQNGVYLTIATAPAMPEETLANFTLENGRVLLRDIDVLAQDDGGTIVRTMWRQDGLPQPLQLFIHALDNEQNIIAQWDGLGASWQGWRTGDTLVQLSSLPVGSDELAGLKLVIGLVDPRTGRRWQTSNNADFYEVGS
jgi:hypothetical protein